MLLKHITPMGYLGPTRTGPKTLRVFGYITPDMLLKHITPVGYLGPTRTGPKTLRVFGYYFWYFFVCSAMRSASSK